jgi:hypothetical protein
MTAQQGEMDIYWQGVLTISNVNVVATFLFRLLEGKKYMKIHSCPHADDYTPRIQTSLQLVPGSEGQSIQVWQDHSSAALKIFENQGVWQIVTKEQEEFDPDVQYPNFSFDGNRVLIKTEDSNGRVNEINLYRVENTTALFMGL